MKRSVVIVGSLALATTAGFALGMRPSLFAEPAIAEAPRADATPEPALSWEDILAARSPGERGHVHLITKVRPSPVRLAKAARPVGEPLPVGEEAVLTIDEIALPIEPIETADIDFFEITQPQPIVVAPVSPSVVSFTPATSIVPPFSPVLPPSGGAVPEPATWAMMLIGLGAVAQAMRRRVARAATA